MPQTAMIDINPGQPNASFSPNPLGVGKNTVISWRNNDTQHPHWPTPAPAAGQPVVNNAWMDFQIPAKLPNEPAPTSIQTVNFADAGTYDYVCALHPNEKGSIVVT
jgi:plastocyanin